MISRSLILLISQAAKIMRRFFYEAPAEIMRNYTTNVAQNFLRPIRLDASLFLDEIIGMTFGTKFIFSVFFFFKGFFLSLSPLYSIHFYGLTTRPLTRIAGICN